MDTLIWVVILENKKNIGIVKNNVPDMINHLYAVIFKSHAYFKNNILKKMLVLFKSIFFKEMQRFLRCGDVEEGMSLLAASVMH